MDIKELEKYDVRKNYIEILKREGITTIEYLASFSKRELEQINGIGPEISKKLWEAALELYVKPKMFMNATKIYDEQKTIEHLTTGSKKLDELLGGGLETHSITEISGEYGSGKTQLAHQLCVNVQLPKEKGGLEGAALYHDVEDTFSVERIKQISEAKGLDPKEALNNIIVAKCYNTDHQVFIMNTSEKIIRKHNVRLIIVDGVMSHLRSEYVGREVLAERQQQLNKYLRKLRNLARAHKAVAFVTNQVVTNPQATYFGPDKTAIGGNIMAHNVVTRLWITRPSDMKTKRIIKLYKSPKLPSGQVVIKITEHGIEDVEDG